MLLKTADLRKNIAFIKPNNTAGKEIKEIIEEISSLISSRENCRNIILDLTGIGFLSGIKIGVVASTHHFIEHMDGKIYIIVNDRQAKKFIEIFNLSNTVVIYNQKSLALDNIA